MSHRKLWENIAVYYAFSCFDREKIQYGTESRAQNIQKNEINVETSWNWIWHICFAQKSHKVIWHRLPCHRYIYIGGIWLLKARGLNYFGEKKNHQQYPMSPKYSKKKRTEILSSWRTKALPSGRWTNILGDFRSTCIWIWIWVCFCSRISCYDDNSCVRTKEKFIQYYIVVIFIMCVQLCKNFMQFEHMLDEFYLLE